MASGYYTYEDDDKGWKIECEVEGKVIPFVPPTREQPHEGGYVEDVSFTVSEFYLTVGGEDFNMSMSLTDDLRETLASVVQNAYDERESVRSSVFAQLDPEA